MTNDDISPELERMALDAQERISRGERTIPWNEIKDQLAEEHTMSNVQLSYILISAAISLVNVTCTCINMLMWRDFREKRRAQ